MLQITGQNCPISADAQLFFWLLRGSGSLCIKGMISSPKLQLLRAKFVVHLIATDHSEVIYDAKENINPFWEIRAYTLIVISSMA